MKLKDNKKGIILENKRDRIDNKVYVRIYCKEKNVRNSNLVIYENENTWLDLLVTSVNFLNVTYHEIKRE